MAIPHALPAQAIDVRPFGARLADEKSVALFKSDDLEVIRLVLPAGKRMPSYKVAGALVLHCIEGRLQVDIDSRQHALHAGQLLHLPGNVAHAVSALEDSSALLTLVVRK
jgi:quercetin dioxygenase-like cupin family protein